MKRLLVLTICGLWGGALSTSSVSAQSNAFTSFVPPPLTNHLGSTNTLVAVTNLSRVQFSDVLTLLLTLQTNVERALPILDMVESNVTFVSPSASNATPLTNVNTHGFITPMTSNPAGVGGPELTPTGAASGTGAQQGQSQASLSVRIGTNTFEIDPGTVEAIATLRDDLQLTLPVLQALNGTTPTATNALTRTDGFINPGVTNFAPGPLTNSFNSPLTNMAPALSTQPILSPGAVSPF